VLQVDANQVKKFYPSPATLAGGGEPYNFSIPLVQLMCIVE